MASSIAALFGEPRGNGAIVALRAANLEPHEFIRGSSQYECVRITVLYSLRDRYPGVDETRPEVQELIGNLTDHAFADIYKGADEDLSDDAAFRYFGKEVDEVCGAES